MARASFIIRKDGRYWFQKRFGVGRQSIPGLPTHCRIALRTADYRVAFSRMLKVLRLMQAYEVEDEIVDRAEVLITEMQRFNSQPGGYSKDELVERRTLESLVTRFIAETRFRNHPLMTSPQAFLADMDDVRKRQRAA